MSTRWIAAAALAAMVSLPLAAEMVTAKSDGMKSMGACGHGMMGNLMDGKEHGQGMMMGGHKMASLKLDEAQKAKIDEIRSDTRRQHQELMKSAQSRIDAVLTTEQREKLAR